MKKFAHYCTMILEDLHKYRGKTFIYVTETINHAVKYDTFFAMLTNSDEEKEELDSEYYATLCMILGLPKHDEENVIIDQSHIDILREYVDKVMRYSAIGGGL